jgi:hypothetical protein
VSEFGQELLRKMGDSLLPQVPVPKSNSSAAAAISITPCWAGPCRLTA